MDVAAEIGRNPVCKHQVDDRADGKLDETKFSGAYGDRGIFIFSVSRPLEGLATLPG